MLTLKLLAVAGGGCFLASLASVPDWITMGLAIGAVWIRIEHRITRLETKIEDKLK